MIEKDANFQQRLNVEFVLVFIHEIEQKDIQRDVSLIFKGIESNFGNRVSLGDRWISYDRQHSDDSYDSCNFPIWLFRSIQRT